MFDFNFVNITAEQVKSGRPLSQALDAAEAQRIWLSDEWIRNLFSKYMAGTG